MDINVSADIAKYETDLNSLIVRLQTLEQDRNKLIEAIHFDQGIIAYLRAKGSETKAA